MADGRKTLSLVDRWVALIPMRAGSKGLPGKNVRLLAGIPLFQHSVDAARRAGASRIVLSTDIESVLSQDLGPEVTAIRRPKDLATDDCPMDRVLTHALGEPGGLMVADSTIVVLLQPTSPLRDVRDIHAGIVALLQSDADLAMGVTPTDNGVLKYGRIVGGRFEPLAEPALCFANRQSLPPVVRPNGAIYAFRAGWFRQNEGLSTSRIAAVPMPAERSIDVDNIEDFERAEALIMNGREGVA